MSFYSSSLVHGGHGCTGAREREAVCHWWLKRCNIVPFVRARVLGQRGVRERCGASLGWCKQGAQRRVFVTVLMTVWGSRSDVSMSVGSMEGWGVGGWRGAGSGAEACKVFAGVHVLGHLRLGGRDSVRGMYPHAWLRPVTMEGV